jgi:chemotaxis protein methyltransferase CheR
MVTETEIKGLIDDIFRISGYDFSEYSNASLKRRILRIIEKDQFDTVSQLRTKLENSPGFLKYVVEEITVNVTEMFRDPSFYRFLRKDVIPKMEGKPLIRIWHAGCSTGEEVYSMAILLKEANLLDRSLIYATDINPDVLEQAGSGIFPMSQMKLYSQNYLASGGVHDFSSYYIANYGQVKFSEELRKKMIFSTHNLVSDRSFNSFDLVMCRNVLIYFNKDLQDKVFSLFDESIDLLGYLALGSKETIRFSAIQHKYKQLAQEKVWQKVA